MTKARLLSVWSSRTVTVCIAYPRRSGSHSAWYRGLWSLVFRIAGDLAADDGLLDALRIPFQAKSRLTAVMVHKSASSPREMLLRITKLLFRKCSRVKSIRSSTKSLEKLL